MKRYCLVIFFILSSIFGSFSQEPDNGHSILSNINPYNWKSSTIPTFNNKTIVLDFWASWCSGCLQSMPHINKLCQSFEKSNVVFVAVNSFDNDKKIKETLKKHKIESFILSDTSKYIYQSYGIKSLPTTIVIGEEGKVIWRGFPGQLNDKVLQGLIEKQESYKYKVHKFSYEVKISEPKNPDTSYIMYIPDFFSSTSITMKLVNRSLPNVINNLAGIGMNLLDSINIINEPIVPFIDFYARLDDEQKSLNDFSWMGISYLSNYYGFSFDTSSISAKVGKIKIENKSKLEQYRIEKCFNKSSIQEDTIILKGNLAFIVERLSMFFKKRLFINSHFDEYYRIVIPMQGYNSVLNLLKGKYGIDVVYTDKIIKLYKIEFPQNHQINFQ